MDRNQIGTERARESERRGVNHGCSRCAAVANGPCECDSASQVWPASSPNPRLPRGAPGARARVPYRGTVVLSRACAPTFMRARVSDCALSTHRGVLGSNRRFAPSSSTANRLFNHLWPFLNLRSYSFSPYSALLLSHTSLRAHLPSDIHIIIILNSMLNMRVEARQASLICELYFNSDSTDSFDRACTYKAFYYAQACTRACV